MDRHLPDAIAELHAARLSLQSALLALGRAVEAGEQISETNLRVIEAELRGTTEEAAVFAVLLDQALASAASPSRVRSTAATTSAVVPTSSATELGTTSAQSPREIP